jgi:putative ABC transport system permease protein
MFDYAVKNITKRWVRSLLTIVGVTVMITLVIVITGIVSYQTRTMHAHASAGAGKINVQPLLAGETYPAEGVNMDTEVADNVLDKTSVYIQPMLSTKVLYLELEPPPYPNQPSDVILVGVETGKEESFTGSISHDVKPVAGVESFNGVDAEQPVILGEHAAEVYSAKLGKSLFIGDQLEVLEERFVLVGILDHSADMVVNNAVIIPLEIAQSTLDKSGFVSSVILTAADMEADEGIHAIVQEQFPQLNVVTDDTIRQNAKAGIKVFEDLVNAIAAVVIVCASLLIMTVTLITVKERTKEIGVLRAIGASNGLIIRSILWEIFLLSSIGSLLGGIISGFVMTYALQENLFDLGHILTYMPLALVLTLVAGILPAVNITRIQPVESLRYE